MGCHGNNATPPSPAIAPGVDLVDPLEVARGVGARGVDRRLAALVPGVDAPFFQAGLAGYSDGAMRIIARRHGCPLCVTEALLDRTLLGGGKGFVKADLGELADNVPGGAEDHPLVGQLMGSEPGEMAAAGLKMVEQGRRSHRAYRELAEGREEEAGRGRAGGAERGGAGGVGGPGSRTFAAIDVNLACPVKKVRSKARGGHWLAEPEGAIEILRAVRAALPDEIPVTVKMRRSFDDAPEMVRAFWRIFDAAYDLGCAWVTVHGRTVRQKYVGPSRWDVLREVVRARPGRLIFGSGDVWEAADIFRMIEYTGVSAVSVARGCIGNPWIFRQAREMMAGREPAPPTLAEQRGVLEQHFELAMAVNHRLRDAEGFTARTMRKFAIRFSQHHREGEAVRKRFIGVKTLDDWRRVLDEHYEAELAPV